MKIQKLGGTINLDMEIEAKLYEVAPCTGDCLSCIKYEQKPIEKTFVLTKKRVSTHYVAPDMTAIKLMNDILAEENAKDCIERMTEEELEALRQSLLRELNDDTRQKQKPKKQRTSKTKKG